MELGRATLLQIYHFMRLTRALEDRMRTLLSQGRIVGGGYTAQGHEAMTIGAAMALHNGDCIVPQHRDLGMHIVQGTNLRSIMCQWLARGNSPTLGRDDQMHIGDMHHGIVPMLGMLGESLPVACGVALTMKMRRRSTVVLASCGDDAVNTGSFHEALNFTASQKLPLVLLIENNDYIYSTPAARQFAMQNLSDRALDYGIPGMSVDGDDVLAVFDAVAQAVGHARSGQGPVLVECRTFRVRDQSESAKADYISAGLYAEWFQKDPIQRFEDYLTGEGVLTVAARAEIEAQIKTLVDDAVRYAEQSPAPDGTAVGQYVFAPAGPIAIIGEPDAHDPLYINAFDSRTGQPFNIVYKAEEAAGRR